jgi:hypothetical protein
VEHRAPGATDAGEVADAEVVVCPRLVAAGGGDDGEMVAPVGYLVGEPADRRVETRQVDGVDDVGAAAP